MPGIDPALWKEHGLPGLVIVALFFIVFYLIKWHRDEREKWYTRAENERANWYQKAEEERKENRTLIRELGDKQLAASDRNLHQLVDEIRRSGS